MTIMYQLLYPEMIVMIGEIHEQNHDYHIKYNSIVYILLKVSLFDAMSFIKLTIEILYTM